MDPEQREDALSPEVPLAPGGRLFFSEEPGLQRERVFALLPGHALAAAAGASRVSSCHTANTCCFSGRIACPSKRDCLEWPRKAGAQAIRGKRRPGCNHR